MKHLKTLAATLALFGSAMAAHAGATAYIPLGSANEVIAVDTATHTITQHYSGVANPRYYEAGCRRG